MSVSMLFANTLRAQPGTIVLADGSDAITLRAQAAEAWDIRQPASSALTMTVEVMFMARSAPARPPSV